MVIERGLPQAVLLTGSNGIGKHQFATALAQLALCQQATDSLACGTCQACRLNKDRHHPDFMILGEHSDDKVIPIDHVRAINHVMSASAHQNGWKILLIKRAHRLNVYSANALLKNLEEPNQKTAFILVTDMPYSLPATIRSRCQHVVLQLPTADQSISWMIESITEHPQNSSDSPVQKNNIEHQVKVLLEHAQYRPILAYTMYENQYPQRYAKCLEIWKRLIHKRCVVSMATEQLMTHMPEETLEWLVQWFIECARFVSAPKYCNSHIPEKLAMLQESSKVLDKEDFIALIDQSMRARALAMGPSNPNMRLLIENLLAECMVHITRHHRQSNVS